MENVVLLLILAFSNGAYSQIHGDTVSCYKCHGADFGVESFPQCLGVTPITCAQGQGCRVLYTTDWNRLPTIGCSSYNPLFDKPPSVECVFGGMANALNDCDVRCINDTCVNSLTTQLMEKAPVVCPSQCSVSNIESCWSNAVVCGKDQFCELDVQSGITGGVCKSRATSESQCLINVFTSRCPDNIFSDPSLSQTHCYIGCCTTNSCVDKLFGVSNIATAAATLPTTPEATTTTTMSTTAATTTKSTVPPYTIYSQLVQECRDHVEPGVCKDLKDTQGLCQSSGAGLHLDICPETCGVCQAIQEANCHDTVLDGECDTLIAEKDICNGPVARYICAASCGLCDMLVEEKLAIIVAAMSSTMPPLATEPTTRPPTSLLPTSPRP